MIACKNLRHVLQSAGGIAASPAAGFATKITAKTTKKIALIEKKNKQLVELKKQLAKKEPVKSADLYEQFHFREVYKRINTQMESFFYERPYTLENFNFLINLIAEQSPEDFKQRIEQVLQKMALLNIKPDDKTYNYMVKAAAHAKQVDLAQLYFKEACQKFVPTKYLYTTLMKTYVINNDPNMALKILDEMSEKGLEPDLPAYTTLINSFRVSRRVEKCWEVHKKLVRSKVPLDETYVGVMMKVYAATHDAETAIKLYKENITEKGIKPMLETTNSYLKALSSRRDYANAAVDKFIQMAESGQIINEQTALWALRACSTLGNVRSAIQILKIMKIKKIQPSAAALTVLLKVYATACLVPLQDQKYREIIITDSWKLLEKLEKMGKVTTHVLNNMLEIYANSINKEEIDGLILPLYQKFGQPKNMYTYQILMDMYYRTSDFQTAMRLWQQMNNTILDNKLAMTEKYEGDQVNFELELNKMNEDIRPSFKALHVYLDIGIKTLNMKQVLEALQLFKKFKKMPKNATLKFLGTLPNLPEEIQASLIDFRIQFGKARLTKKAPKNYKDPQYV